MPDHGWHHGKNYGNLSFWVSKNCLSGVFLVHFLHVISGVFLVHFLHVISAIYFVIKLVVLMHAYIMLNIALLLKGKKILFQSFLVRLEENFLEFCLILIGLFFLSMKKVSKKKLDSSPFFPQ